MQSVHSSVTHFHHQVIAINMEERHTFSEPRVAYGYDKLTWNVDVFREGVEDPVCTLVIDEESMPPRMRKKKIVWRLPETQESLPKFGIEEKKRLLELFKLEKKTRRKSKLKSFDVDDGSGPRGESTSSIQQQPQQEDCSVCVQAHNADQPSGCEMFKYTIEEKKDDVGVSHGTILSWASDERTQQEMQEMKSIEQTPSGLPIIMNDDIHPVAIPSTESYMKDMPPSIRPPPGLTTPNFTPSSRNTKYFSIPCTSCDAAVLLAQELMEVYYSSMTHGQQKDLLLYYFEGAVKSLSLGGAHSFCKSREEILLQLNSLQGSLWDVSAVVAQDGFMDSIVLLLTGNALPKTAPAPLSFSHSITLIKLPEGYQIHNDAMALMTPG